MKKRPESVTKLKLNFLYSTVDLSFTNTVYTIHVCCLNMWLIIGVYGYAHAVDHKLCFISNELNTENLEIILNLNHILNWLWHSPARN